MHRRLCDESKSAARAIRGRSVVLPGAGQIQRVVTARDEAFIRTPLEELAAALDTETFWQVHRNVIVRVSAIHALERDSNGRLALSLHGKADKLPVGSDLQHRFKGM